MKSDFSKLIICDDGREREFHFARTNTAAIYYHVSVIDSNGKLLTITMGRDEDGEWKMQSEDVPEWLQRTESQLALAINEVNQEAG